MTMHERDLYIKALEKWGFASQKQMAIEELAELIVALSKFGRKINRSTVKDIASELTDAKIMIEQLQIIFKIDNTEIYELKQKKLKRLEELLSIEEE